MSGKFGNYFSCLDEENQSKSDKRKETKNRFENISTIFISSSFDSNEADVLKEMLHKTSTLTQMDLTNHVPTNVMQAISEGMQYNNTVTQISYRETNDNLFEDQIEEENPSYLREILSIPRIIYYLELQENSLALQIIKSTSNQNIKRLSVRVNGSQLDELLEGLSTNEIIETIDVTRLDMNNKCSNIALFGKIKKLTKLTIQIHEDECELFSAALKNNNLCMLYLSNSLLTPKSAKHLADLIATSNNLNTLDLSKCLIDNETFSIICQGVIESTSLTGLIVLDNPFDGLDPTIVKSGERKKLKELRTHIFDSNMAKAFDITFLTHEGTNFDGLKIAKIRILRLSVLALRDAQHVTNLFNSLNFNRSIKSLAIYPGSGYTLPDEFWSLLTANKTLKYLDITYMQFDEKSFKLLCEMIEKNNTLETFIHDGTFLMTAENWDFTYIPIQPLLEALKNNTSLTKVDFYRLHCEDRDLEDVLLANPYISFTELADRTRGSRASKLNNRNLKNINTRLRNIKCNVMTLASSYLSNTLPMELWQLILDDIYCADVDYIELFKKSMRK